MREQERKKERDVYRDREWGDRWEREKKWKPLTKILDFKTQILFLIQFGHLKITLAGFPYIRKYIFLFGEYFGRFLYNNIKRLVLWSSFLAITKKYINMDIWSNYSCTESQRLAVKADISFKAGKNKHLIAKW
jgi:hypothetical protein